MDGKNCSADLFPTLQSAGLGTICEVKIKRLRGKKVQRLGGSKEITMAYCLRLVT